MKTKIFPIIIIVLSICAGGVYIFKGDIKHGLFWLFAAGVNVCANL